MITECAVCDWHSDTRMYGFDFVFTSLHSLARDLILTLFFFLNCPSVYESFHFNFLPLRLFLLPSLLCFFLLLPLTPPLPPLRLPPSSSSFISSSSSYFLYALNFAQRWNPLRLENKMSFQAVSSLSLSQSVSLSVCHCLSLSLSLILFVITCAI